MSALAVDGAGELRAEAAAAIEALAQLARGGHTEALREALVALGGDPVVASLRDHKGDSLLMLAAYHGHAGTVAMLAELGAAVDARNAAGLAPLDGAAFKGDVPVMSALRRAGASLEVRAPDGRTALMWASAFGRAEAIAWLLDHGADLTAADASGLTAADHAARMGAIAVLPLLSAAALHRSAPR